MSTINATFFQLVAAFFVAFMLGHFTTRYFERFERFPSPLVMSGPEPPMPAQGRDYLPHRLRPTVPPGPLVPNAVESDAHLYETTPPRIVPRQLAAQTQAPLGARPAMPYALTNDDYLSFLTPEQTTTLAPTLAPR